MASTRTRSTKKADTRQPNVQPNHMPATILLTVLSMGAEIGSIEIEQAAKLSEIGNVTYSGGVKDGWDLGESWMDALGKLSFRVGGVDLKVAATAVHQSESGNPTVGHFGVVTLESAKDEGGKTYRVEVYATWLVKKGSYSLSVRAFPQGQAARGPQIAGTVTGLVVTPRD